MDYDSDPFFHIIVKLAHPANFGDSESLPLWELDDGIIEGALKSLHEQQGPVGAQGVLLTPGRSLAVDRRYIPLGIPIWLDTTDPVNISEPLRRLVIAQDTGSAIKGPVRGDLFWGFGSLAATKAGLMKQSGRYFLLLPKK